jgi:hypothetical protein
MTPHLLTVFLGTIIAERTHELFGLVEVTKSARKVNNTFAFAARGDHMVVRRLPRGEHRPAEHALVRNNHLSEGTTDGVIGFQGTFLMGSQRGARMETLSARLSRPQLDFTHKIILFKFDLI